MDESVNLFLHNSIVPHFPDGLAQHVKDFLADLHQLVLLVMGVMEP